MNETCLICLEEVVPEIRGHLFCRHVYHVVCILEWSSIRATCPACKQSFTHIEQISKSEERIRHYLPTLDIKTRGRNTVRADNTRHHLLQNITSRPATRFVQHMTRGGSQYGGASASSYGASSSQYGAFPRIGEEPLESLRQAHRQTKNRVAQVWTQTSARKRRGDLSEWGEEPSVKKQKAGNKVSSFSNRMKHVWEGMQKATGVQEQEAFLPTLSSFFQNLSVVEKMSIVSDHGCLKRFQSWLSPSTSLAVVRELLTLLDTLPITSENIVQNRTIVPQIMYFCTHRIGNASTCKPLATQLIEKWSALAAQHYQSSTIDAASDPLVEGAVREYIKSCLMPNFREQRINRDQFKRITQYTTALFLKEGRSMRSSCLEASGKLSTFCRRRLDALVLYHIKHVDSFSTYHSSGTKIPSRTD